MESATDSLQPPAESEEPKNVSEDEILLSKAKNFISKITSSQENPNPKVLNALASILETQESRYIEESGHSSDTNGRASHSIGRLGNLVQENDDFCELISSKFLTETRYSTSIRAASARLLLSCSVTWMYPHVFEDGVLENIKSWVLDDNVRNFGDECNVKHDSGKYTPTDSEMLRTYATGLLAVCLSGGGQVVEDVLTSGLSAKLMRYLRTRVLGETSSSKKDSSYLTEYKNTSGASCIKSREESRGRFWQVLDGTQLDGPRLVDEGFLDDQSGERDHDKTISIRQACGEECWDDDGESLKSREYADDLPEGVDVFEVDEDDVEPLNEEKRQNRDLHDGKSKFGDRYSTSRSMRDEDCEENIRDESSRRRTNRGWARIRGKGRANEGAVDNDRVLTSPGSGIRLGGQSRVVRERNQIRYQDVKRVSDAKKSSGRIDADGFGAAREDNDDPFQECKVGTRDISDVVKKAVRAAEAEARTANAPAEAIKAAGDAAAELVKSAAIEEFKSTNDEEAAVLAASKAASTVIDAANATEVSRRSTNLHEDSIDSKATESDKDEELEGSFVLDKYSLAQLREKYCVQCLEKLGEYVEVLGPVLHEKGVDVCLELLQRSSKNRETANFTILLPDVLKLICALAAHRKFAALLVDRSGMQKLLAVPRIAQTFFGLSSCLFTIGSLQGIMERVCALPPDIVNQVVELALQLLECQQDQARKNAAVFFAAAFVFRAVVDSFDAQDGLQKFLNLLHGAASVRSGGNSGPLTLSNLGSLRNDRSPAEVLTASEKQIAYHTCVALRQYFRAHLLLLVDSIRPNKNRSVTRHIPSSRAAYKPLDISNEAMDAVFLQIQRDRKLGPAFVRACWPSVEKFLASNGHIIMLELCQAPTVERYLHDLAQYALGVLQIVTLVSNGCKLIVNATLSNHRVGMAVILDAANGAGYVDPEVIQPALNVLVNLVCPPPSISNKPVVLAQGQQSISIQTSNDSTVENRERHAERNILDRNLSLPIQNESREWNGESAVAERGHSTVLGMPASNNNSQAAVSNVTSGVVGDRRISLGSGTGCAGFATHLEQGYRQAREVVRANNGIKVLLHLLHPRILTPLSALDCIRALACRVLLGLARDESIAHILTKLQVGKKLSELIRDSGNQTPGSEQGRWHAELAQVAIELIGIVTNSGRASTLAATDAAAPTLRRIERAAIAAATPITYHSRELLLLIHEHLQASGLTSTADSLLKEAQLTPLRSSAAPPPLRHQIYVQETPHTQIQWPSGRTPCGFISDASKPTARDEDSSLKTDSVVPSLKKKPLLFSPNISFQSRNQALSNPPSNSKCSGTSRYASAASGVSDASAVSALKPCVDTELQFKTPIVLPVKRKLTDFKDSGFASQGKRHATGEHVFRSPICQTPSTVRRSNQPMDSIGLSVTQSSSQWDQFGRSTASGIVTDNLDNSQQNSSTPLGPMTPSSSLPGLLADSVSSITERVTLDHLVVQYLKHQHRQCPAPITTLPPLSLLYPHMCPESRRNVDAPANVTARLSTREFRNHYGGIHGNHMDRQFVYRRFRPWRTCRDDGTLLTCITFLGDSSQIATGSHSGELKIFDSNSGNVLESYTSHQSSISHVQSALCGDSQLILSSGSYDVRLWDASSVSAGPMRSFEGCKLARFSNSGTTFAALSSESSRREVLLYDIQTFNLELKLSDSSTISSGPGRGHVQSLIHFSPLDTMLLWNGVLWDRRGSGPVHRFDQFTDYGGGGFHPAGNEVIINSEVWDLRKFKLLRSVPSLDQTVITFNGRGDVIYAILRRNLEDITSAVNTRRVRHPLFSAFRTVDAVNYSDIATVPVDRCVLDFSTEPTDSFVGLVSMDDHEEMFASARLYEIGRRRPTDDDSDPDDAETEEDDDDSGADEPISGTDLDADIDSEGDDMSNGDEDDDESIDEMDEDDEDGDFVIDNLDFDAGTGILEIVTEGDEEEDDEVVGSFSSGEEGDMDNRFGF
ncbi:DDB1- and CUL4-associated factor homolog 1-like isoform X2 [Telopea speciosissima]|uniref:DDB1- and CUL4-associated factor homolog 1-like isoform X2 n=1 Tax=Telopea speciosissima TaxID=54955 RepID=UPI001CC59D7C|nr:DDB1- and CUL4-associated factor homolog 1-like isoform X2 [Telopea speciosissima]